MTVYQEDYAYPVEADRYQLVIAYPCPYAHRPAIARELLGLEDVVGLSITDSVKTERVWGFANYPGARDPETGAKYVDEFYKNVDPSYEGPYSVPALVDTSNYQVVNQESLDILYDFATRFKDFHKAGAPDLYPEGKEEEIEEWFSFVGSRLMKSSGAAAYADSQEEYEEHYQAYFATLEELNAHFKDRAYAVGDSLTAADIVLFTPLIRHDAAYYKFYNLNEKHLYDYENLFAYIKGLYQIDAFKNTTDFDELKAGMALGTTGQKLKDQHIVPLGPDLSMYEA